MRTDARVGVHDPESQQDQLRKAEAYTQRVMAYLEGNAVKIEAAGLLSIAASLRDISVEYQGGLDLKDFDEKLDDLDDEIFEALIARMPEDEMASCRKQVDAHIAQMPATSRMEPKQREAVKQQYLRRTLYERAAVPRLSLFYMPAS